MNKLPLAFCVLKNETRTFYMHKEVRETCQTTTAVAVTN